MQSYTVPINNKSIFLYPTSREEIDNAVNDLKNKAGGADGVSAKVIKLLANEIVEPLDHILNICIKNSTWPEKLKYAVVVPIYKAGEKCNITNYRPISLISNFAKIFEKIIHKRLYRFFIGSGILSEKQFGFMKNKGTKDALAVISNYIYKKLNKGISRIATF